MYTHTRRHEAEIIMQKVAATTAAATLTCQSSNSSLTEQSVPREHIQIHVTFYTYYTSLNDGCTVMMMMAGKIDRQTLWE